ncbi:MAG TPA: glutathione S-transferase family protein [Burkholderiales bacterium]|nr:glutathione S-transferase family protein [Burkholderiales bacterium]
MKIYYHPVSTTSRPLVLFCQENSLPVEFQVVDLMKGEHYQPEYIAVNPSRLVPVLEDGDFRLTESSAILKYLAERFQSPAYPSELKARAKVNETMDWINTQLCRDLAYGFVYPQIFPTHKRPSEELQKGTLAWAKERAKGWMKVLDESLIGPKKAYLCGDAITIADYFASSFVSLAEFIRCDFGAYPNLNRWYQRMKGLKSWSKVHEIFYGFAGSMKDVAFERI